MEYTASTEPTPYPTTPKNDEYKKQQHRIKEEEHLCLIWRLMHQIELVNTHGPLSKDTYTPGPLATDKHTFELLSQDTYTLTPSPKGKYAPEPTLIFIETSEIHPLELSTTILNGILCITTLGLSFILIYLHVIDIFASNLDCQPNSTYDPTIEPTTETQSNQIKKRIIILALRLNPITYGLLGVNGSHISNPTPTPADTSLTTSNPTSDPAHPSHTATPNDVQQPSTDAIFLDPTNDPTTDSAPEPTDMSIAITHGPSIQSTHASFGGLNRLNVPLSIDIKHERLTSIPFVVIGVQIGNGQMINLICLFKF